jgi:long-chain acyl-CoA synthetase
MPEVSSKEERASASALAHLPAEPSIATAPPPAAQTPSTYIYPRWPWLPPIQWLRAAFIEAIMRPLVWFLAAPHVVVPAKLEPPEPILIVANHITTYDGPLIQYALPSPIRRRIAAVMSGDMLEDYRHFRNPERKPGTRGFYPFGPLAWFLVTALFNVFPLPRRRDFQQSFAHAGLALDRGYNVLVFPEGTRSAAGELARFRSGIGLLVRQSGTLVLPVALSGLGELKARGRGWFRSGSIEIRVGSLIRFAPEATESEITSRLHSEVAKLLS